MNNARQNQYNFQEQKEGIFERNIHQLETSNKNRNIRDLYRVINNIKKGYQTRT
jgi:hypothetical protein